VYALIYKAFRLPFLPKTDAKLHAPFKTIQEPFKIRVCIDIQGF